MALGFILTLLKDFSCWCSAHGIPQIGQARNILLRIVWIITYCCFLFIFGYQLYQILTKYYEYGIVVSTGIKFDERVFPAVTICSLNPYKKSQVAASSPEIKTLLTTYQTFLKGKSTSDQYGFKEKKTALEQKTLAETAMTYIASGLDDQTWSKLTYTFDEIFLDCRFGKNPCENTKDFIKTKDPLYGACYTFNSDSKYKIDRIGSQNGLSLLLKVEQGDFLPTTDITAYRVVVHDQGIEPFPDAFGFNAAVGHINSLGAKFKETRRLQQPYGSCSKDKTELEHFYYSKSRYSEEACLRSCYQKKIVAACRCSDPRFQRPSKTSPICPFNKLKCVEDAMLQGEECKCNQVCNETTYSLTKSQSYWPQQSNIPVRQLPSTQGKGCESKNWGTAAMSDCMEWWNRNTLRIEVFYEKLNFEQLESSEAYTVLDIIMDLGGQIGLWLGLSVVSIVELFSFAYRFVFILILYYRSKDSRPVENEVKDKEKKHKHRKKEEDNHEKEENKKNKKRKRSKKVQPTK